MDDSPSKQQASWVGSPDWVVDRTDPAGFGTAVGKLAAAAAAHPGALAEATIQAGSYSVRAALAAGLLATGNPAPGPVPLPEKDARFADAAWSENPLFYYLRNQHAVAEHYARRLLAETAVDEQTRAKARFAVDQVLDALAPSNNPVTNPAVLKKAFDTGGRSLLRGARNLVRDVVESGGRPRQVVPGRFRVGTELAATPGKVVYRNELIELIQYEPQTPTVHQVPMLLSPPWINKYYIMDLAHERSLVEWAVQHGHTCFMISYRNPGPESAELTLSDYLLHGPKAALDVVTEVTGAPEVNVTALCVGGTLATAMCAWLAARGERTVHSLTALNTLLDFDDPGQLGVLTDEETVRRLSRVMGATGYLSATTMTTTFDLLRANDLLWSYVVNDWMLGEEPKAFDILAWNEDSMRMAGRTHAEYLRTCYTENQLARGEMELAGQRLELGKIDHDAYFVSAQNDHIAPWPAVFHGARQLGGQVRFALSNAGHIAGVVNPPGGRSRHWVSELEASSTDPETWKAGASYVEGTWWHDWTPWIAERAGEKVQPPPMGSAAHPPLEDAPGHYVRES
jgi:polyhydroxyalkanoate synthase